jgi:GT2 family glycosyltransferase
MLAVVLATYAPDRARLLRVLAALRSQTLPLTEWELCVVDNASPEPLHPWLDLSWHPASQLMQEPEPGRLNALITGSQACSHPLLVFVDDDTLLAPDYLEQSLRLFHTHPQVAVWSGQSVPEFAAPPPDWTRPWWPMLALTEFAEDELPDPWTPAHPLPHGAGMGVRHDLFKAYCAAYSPLSTRALLGRREKSLMSGEDHDLALFALTQGQRVGRFTTLRLTHLIPASRLTRPYLLQLATAMAASGQILAALYPQLCQTRRPRYPHWLRVLWHFLKRPSFQRSLRLAQLQGEKIGHRLLTQSRVRPRIEIRQGR